MLAELVESEHVQAIDAETAGTLKTIASRKASPSHPMRGSRRSSTRPRATAASSQKRCAMGLVMLSSCGQGRNGAPASRDIRCSTTATAHLARRPRSQGVVRDRYGKDDVEPQARPARSSVDLHRIDLQRAYFVRTMRVVLCFEWDPAKAAANLRKHGVSFEDAQTAFSDEHARLVGDPDHSAEEERFVLLGLSSSLRLLVVAHCYRSADSIIRIISARRATKAETRSYP
jgi:uncharacterized protein